MFFVPESEAEIKLHILNASIKKKEGKKSESTDFEAIICCGLHGRFL